MFLDQPSVLYFQRPNMMKKCIFFSGFTGTAVIGPTGDVKTQVLSNDAYCCF